MATQSSSSSSWSPAGVFVHPIQKSPLDDRTYRLLKLDNGLECLIIQDDKADKSAAAMDVGTGHLMDPASLPGCAHFCEHLSFMGTEMFPKENDYSEFLNQNGGNSNAFTGMENTNYHFDVSPPALLPALTRFAQFFRSPLFSPSCVERELKAVDSEHSKNLLHDMWRQFQLEKSLAKKDHAYSKFGTGNWQTLWVDVLARGGEPREELLKWWKESYGAGVMKLVVLGKGGVIQSTSAIVKLSLNIFVPLSLFNHSVLLASIDDIDTLQSWVTDLFSPIPNNNILPHPGFPSEPFADDVLGTFTYSKTIKDIHSMNLSFVVPDQERLYLSKPCNLLAHYIGHEGEGSLLSLLKGKGLVNGISAGQSEGAQGFTFFRIMLELTPQGIKLHEEVALTVFKYLQLLKSAPREHFEETWIECQKLAELSFRFAEKSSQPADYVSNLSAQLTGAGVYGYPKEWVVSQPWLLREWNWAEFKDTLEALDIRRCLINVLENKDHPKGWDGKEPVYGTEYRVEKFSERFIDIANSSEIVTDLKLPTPNQFIPSDVSVFKPESTTDIVPKEKPALIKQDALSELWYKKDDRFWVPRANLWVGIRNPILESTPLNAVTARLFIDLFTDHMTEKLYPAELAGLKCQIQYSGSGFIFSTMGYHDKLAELMKETLLELKQYKIAKDRFEILKDDLRRNLENHSLGEPWNLCNYYGAYVIEESMWTPNERLAVLDSVSIESTEALMKEALGKMFFKTLAHGNLSSETSKELHSFIAATFSPATLTVEEANSEHGLFLPPSSEHIWTLPVPNTVNPNSGVDYYCQTGLLSDDYIRPMTSFLAQIASEPCFDVLRTKEQLGYLVNCGGRSHTDIVGFHVMVQSQNDTIYLESRIEAFLDSLKVFIETMAQDDFDRQKASLIDEYKQKVKNLYQESSRMWNHISSGYYDFARRIKDCETIEKFTKEELLEFFMTFVHQSSPTRRKLSVHLRTQYTAPEFDPMAVQPILGLMMQNQIDLRQAAFDQLLTQSPTIADVQAFARDCVAAAPASVTEVVKNELLQQIDGLATATSNGDAVSEEVLERKKNAKVREGNISIKDIRAFKKSLKTTPMPVPVVPLDQFKA